MAELSPESKQVLLTIYIGQNIRTEGILQSDVKGKKDARDCLLLLLSEGYILESHWYLDQFRTTNKGSEMARAAIERMIQEDDQLIRNKTNEIPRKVLTFFARRYIRNGLAFKMSKPKCSGIWEDAILIDSRVWALWGKLFSILQSHGLCVQAHDYAAKEGGEIREECFVISPEVGDYLVGLFHNADFTLEQENTVRIYPIFEKLLEILSTNDLDFVRQNLYQLLKDFSVTEEQLAAIIDAMNRVGITTQYCDLLSGWKPFEILDSVRFQLYLQEKLLEPAVRILLEKESEIQTFATEKRIQSYDEELSRFYIAVSSFERRLRYFIKAVLGKNWRKRIETDFPGITSKWREREEYDEKLGMEVEKEPINYADLDDYVTIVNQYRRLFVDGEAELEDVKVKLKDWYRYGRNPLMHSRTCDKLKVATTESAIKYLEAWMKRKVGEKGKDQ